VKNHIEETLALLPCVLLIVVGLFNFLLVKQNDLSIWYGGGFGMFASLDGPTKRYFIVTTLNGYREAQISLEDYETEVARIKTLPTLKRIQSFLYTLCAEQSSSTTQLTARLFKLRYQPKTQEVDTILWKEVDVECT
jgi:hypothetical protein